MAGIADRGLVDILLVEDSDDDADLMAGALREGSLCSRITVVKDGVEAMQVLRREGEHSNTPAPHLILLDLHLPRMNGREVLMEIKGDPKLRRIPVVIMTGTENDHDIVEAYGLHANCCVRKPADLESFSQAVLTIERFWSRVARRV
jgi:two-component system, chemotaxis family, response regulator Rcp1